MKTTYWLYKRITDNNSIWTYGILCLLNGLTIEEMFPYDRSEKHIQVSDEFFNFAFGLKDIKWRSNREQRIPNSDLLLLRDTDIEKIKNKFPESFV